MSLGKSMSVRRRFQEQAHRDAVVLAVKKELAAAVQYEQADPALTEAIHRLALKGRVAGLDYDVRELPSRMCVLMLPVGHVNFDKLTNQ